MLENMSLRELQLECARVVASMEATKHNIAQFNKHAVHDSQQWYKHVISWYIQKYGDLPSKVGPGKDILLKYAN